MQAALVAGGARVTIADPDDVGLEVAVKEMHARGDGSTNAFALDVRRADPTR